MVGAIFFFFFIHTHTHTHTQLYSFVWIHEIIDMSSFLFNKNSRIQKKKRNDELLSLLDPD